MLRRLEEAKVSELLGSALAEELVNVSSTSLVVDEAEIEAAVVVELETPKDSSGDAVARLEIELKAEVVTSGAEVVVDEADTESEDIAELKFVGTARTELSVELGISESGEGVEGAMFEVEDIRELDTKLLSVEVSE